MKFLKTKESQGKMIKFFILFVYLPLGVSVALLTPDNILDYKWARIYTDFMASWLPYVAEVGRWTKVPATQFIAAVMNMVAILCSLSMIYVNVKHYLEWTINRQREALRKEKRMLLFSILFISSACYVVLFLAPIYDPPGSRDRLMIGSNLGMGLYGSLIIASGWLMMALVIVAIIALLVLTQRYLMQKRE